LPRLPVYAYGSAEAGSEVYERQQQQVVKKTFLMFATFIIIDPAIKITGLTE
jgi:hypothetical protein